MNNHTLHETIVRDIFDVVHDFKNSDEVQRINNFRDGSSIKSITSKAQALTMVFPVICSRNMGYDTACMISKAIERKCVTLLQMLFSAANITDAEDGIDYISRFHSNLNNGRLSVDEFMKTMDTIIEENGLLQEDTDEYEYYKMLSEDMKAMNCYFEMQNINEVPLEAYELRTVGENTVLTCLTEQEEPLNEAKRRTYRRTIDIPMEDYDRAYNYLMQMYGGSKNPSYIPLEDDLLNTVNNWEIHKYEDEVEAEKKQMITNYSDRIRDEKRKSDLYFAQNQKLKDENKKIKDDTEFNRQATKRKLAQGDEANRISRAKADSQIAKDDMEMRKAAMDIAALQANIMKNRLVDNDIKKANELVPTLMYVNFVSKGDADSKYPIATSMVVGVKAKLYAVDGEDIMNRLKIKHNSNNKLLNLVKVSTREISFFKDLLFTTDKAKIDALSQSRRGSSSSLWKVLERRANKSKIRRLLNMKNDATAISTLCITQDEVEYLKKTSYFSVEDMRVIRPIMNAYNLMGFVIADESLEVCKFLFDDDERQFEILTFDMLEREQRDNTKKILNLMAKMR